MNGPYRVPGTVDPPPPPRRWGATRYRKWLYLYVEQVVGLMDFLQFFTTPADRRVIVRGLLKSSSRRRTNE